jgi:hypothetical protein
MTAIGITTAIELFRIIITAIVSIRNNSSFYSSYPLGHRCRYYYRYRRRHCRRHRRRRRVY